MSLSRPAAGAARRIFLSHTGELAEFPPSRSFVAAAQAAIIRAGDAVTEMGYFPACDTPPACYCEGKVREADIYVGLIGLRYGSPVRDQPEVSYTELEYNTATEAGKTRLLFVLDEDAVVPIPPSRLLDRDPGLQERQRAFRDRIRDARVMAARFADPGSLELQVLHALGDLHDPHRARPGPVVSGDVPQQPPDWQPRPALLAALEDAGPGSRVVVRAMTGMRGVGKTQLAAALARARIRQRWRLVAWINAETESGLLAGLAETAAAVGLPADDARTAGRAVRHWLEADGERCLVVLDNATDPELIQPYLPAAGRGHVIITSNHHLISALGEPVDVDVFTEDEGLAFLARRTQLADGEAARAAGQEVGWLPLALAQAAAVMTTQHLDYPTYLARLRYLPAADQLPAIPGGNYPRSAAAAILLSFSAVTKADRTGACAGIMNLLAVLAPTGAPRSLIHAAARSGALRPRQARAQLSPAQADRALGQLAADSLLTFSIDGTTVAAHRLVTRVIRDHLAASSQLAATGQAAADLLTSQAEALRHEWHHDRAATRDLTGQIAALHQVTTTTAIPDQLTRSMLWLRSQAIKFLSDLGDSMTQAMQLGETLLADQERTLGADHPDTLSSRNNLAAAYRDAGRITEAITLHERTLADRERTLGPAHPDTLASRSNLAAAYRDAGRTAEAITLHQAVLADYERILGAGHPDTLQSRNNLASAYQDAGRTTDAITLHEANLADRERTLGPDHPHTLQSRNNLAYAYQDAGRIAEAITLHEANLADRERTLGPDHPDTLASRSNLAAAYRGAGRITEAIALHEATLADLERTLGPDHPGTLAIRNNLALAYRDAGRTAEAIALHEATLADLERTLGPGHPATRQSRRNLALAYRAAGQAGQAGELDGELDGGR